MIHKSREESSDREGAGVNWSRRRMVGDRGGGSCFLLCGLAAAGAGGFAHEKATGLLSKFR